MNFIEQTIKRMVDNLEPVVPNKFVNLTYPEKCRQALSLFIEFNNTEHPRPAKINTASEVVTLIVPFIIPPRPGCVIRSVSLATEKQLIDDLVGAELPSNVDDNYFKKHREFDNWFVQLPEECFKYAESIWLCALFYIPISNITAIVCRDSSEYLYTIERDGKISTTSTLFADEKKIRSAKTLAQLLILHYDSKRQQNHEFTERKTYPKNNKASTKKRGKRNLKYSLFRTINIDYQGDYKRFDIKAGKTRKVLDHSFPVRGHFRWQAYGKKHGKHKLLWIDSFIKGRGELDARAQKIKL